MSKKIDEIKLVIEDYFKITNIEWDKTAAAFHIESSDGVLDSFDDARKELKEVCDVIIDEKDLREILNHIPN